MSKRSQTLDLLLALSPQQQSDLLLFERFKKWTAEYLAMINYIDQSSANRRLHRLVAAGVLAMRRGQPLPYGGRQPNLYYPTPLGARVITHLRKRNNHYVTAPDVSNIFDNDHDLAALEIAVRSGMFQEARGFEAREVLDTGHTIKVIPDVYFPPNVFSPSETFVEVEQTERVEHIREKYEKYARISWLYQQARKVPPRLATIFPTEHLFDLLYRDHATAAQAAARQYPMALNFKYTMLSELRERRVRVFERKTCGTDAQGPIIEIEGLLQCLYDLVNE